MKIEFVKNSEKTIYGIEKKNSSSNQFLLNWKSTNLSNYLIVFGNEKKTVDFCEENNQKLLLNLLENAGETLLENKQLVIKDMGLTLSILSHNDIKRDGGMKIRENPGVYAIYGLEYSDSFLTIFVPNSDSFKSSVFTMILDVSIKDYPYYVEKGLFKKRSVYSGYHKVDILKPYPSMVGGILNYQIENYSFSFPDSVIKSGGSFFVKMQENDVIEFKSTNPGIQIK